MIKDEAAELDAVRIKEIREFAKECSSPEELVNHIIVASVPADKAKEMLKEFESLGYVQCSCSNRYGEQS